MGIDPMDDLRALGYEYRGSPARLFKVGSDAGFEFQGDDHYGSLAEAVSEYVALSLEDEAGLEPLWLPLGTDSGEGCPVFVNSSFDTAERLLVIIQGAGRVRAGVWGCSLCINNDLEWGTALPYLRRASAEGYGILVLNPNHNRCEGSAITGSETPDRHVGYVWEHVVGARCCAARIDVIAHSAGGHALLNCLSRSPTTVAIGARLPATSRLNRIIFTDSYHTKQQVLKLPAGVRLILEDSARTVNFVPHSSSLGTPVDKWTSQEYTFTREEKGCSCLSACTEDHASTNHAALDEVFSFLNAPVRDRSFSCPL